MERILKPSDFLAPKPEVFREELVSKMLKAEQTRTQTGVELTITDEDKYRTENLVDLQSFYAVKGGWSEVTTKRSLNGLTIEIFLKF